ncbi:hypothetical protein evm_010924 [Chilo suppressalis]|nr:hypothetical protein evm_010924 [Chilo suppressalis]
MAEFYSVLLTTVWLPLVLASYYFHEPSRIILKPDPLKDHDTFGFSMGYQDGNASLIVGAPQSNLIGKVFQCDLEDILKNRAEFCNDVNIDVDNLAPYNRNYTPNLKFNLGASIAVTSDYFFTCAPLWTTIPINNPSKNFSYGTCFTYNGTAQRYSGLIENHQLNPDSVHPFNIMFGGTGWRTLIDEVNEMLLVAKVALVGDVVYMNSSNPLEKVRSLVAKSKDTNTDLHREYLKNYRLFGNSIVAGNFFDNGMVYYAVSAITESMEGIVHFLKARFSKSEKNTKKIYMQKDSSRSGVARSKKKYIKITDNTVGSMFGAAMAAADLNNDGVSELLVGAPAQDGQESGSETGAIHIYLGGDISSINENYRHREIVSSKDSSRFGSAIAATDVDADDLPEIFVSAPYEDDGVGAVYILSGYEINKTLINGEKYKRIDLHKLRMIQTISMKEFKTFGYSLQKIPDSNDNGCDELAIGAPGSNHIVLMKCVSAVNITVSANLVGAKIVQEQDSNFTVKVCVSVKHLKGKNFSIELKASNEIIGTGAMIEVPQTNFQWTITGNTKEEIRCEDVVVKLNDNEPGEYSFSTKVEMDEEKIKKSDNFNESWVMVSPQSLMDFNFEVSRHCTGRDCDPNLNVTIEWTVSDYYQLGTSDTLSPVLQVFNSGNSSFESCVLVHVSGAPVSQIGCGDKSDGYKCYMPRPLRRNAMHTIPIVFNVSHPTNQQKELRIQVSLFEFCNQPNVKEFDFVLPYKVDVDKIVLKSSGHGQTISDVEIKDVREESINDAHEYLIVNEGPVTYNNINLMIAIEKRPFIQTYRVSTYGCKDISNDQSALFECSLNLRPHAIVKVIATSVIQKSKIVENLKAGKLQVASHLTLSLDHNNTVVRKTNLTTFITWQKELSLAQNKQLIIFLAVLGASVALALVIFILYKMEFFKRKEKTKLDALKKEHIRRKSIKRTMSEDANEEDLDMEVEDDSPFEIVDMSDPVLQQESKL